MRGPLLAAALLVLSAAPAQAATLAATADPYEALYVDQITFTAEPGEANDLGIVRREDDRHVVFHDAGAEIRVVEGTLCRSVDERTVDCGYLPPRIEVHTHDGADRVVAAGDFVGGPVFGRLGDGPDRGSGPAFFEGAEGDDELSGWSADGGAGDDRLTVTGNPGSADGGPGADRVTGTSGDDQLSGGPGQDEVHAGAGSDFIRDDDFTGPAPDLYDGGDGRDAISYGTRRDGVAVDLTAQTAGARGEGDRLEGIEIAHGGEGDDVLTGTDAADALDGGRGRDALDGRAADDMVAGGPGDDLIAGGSGRDLVTGGAGADVLGGGDGDDDMHAGPGDDMLLGGAGDDSLDAGFGIDAVDGGDGGDEVRAFDSLSDRIACGPGRDSGEADAGDRADAACEALARRPLPPMLVAHGLRRGRRVVTVVQGQALVLPPCPSAGCHGTITLRIGRRVVARGRWDCGWESDDDCYRPLDEAPALPLPAWVLRRLDGRGSVRGTALLVHDPGIERGALARPERIVLVRG